VTEVDQVSAALAPTETPGPTDTAPRSPAAGPSGGRPSSRGRHAAAGRSARDWAGLAVFWAGAVTAVAWLMTLGRGMTFYYDEWDFVQTKNVGFWSVDLSSHNGHPVVLPFALYRLLFLVAGLNHFWPYQLALVALVVASGWFLFVLIRRRLHPVVAGAVAAVFILLGPAFQDLLWPFQIEFVGSVAGGLAALTLLDRRTRRADIGACACLVAAACCSGIVVPFLIGTAVELAWRRADWRRLWVPVIPGILFGLWYVEKGRQDNTPVHVTLSAMAHDIGFSAALTVGALVGRGQRVGDVLAVVLAGAVVAAVVRSPGRAGRLAMAVSGVLSFWAITAYDRGAANVGSSRYLFPAAALVLVAVAEVPGLLRVPAVARSGSRHWWSATVVGDAAAVVVVAYGALAIFWNSTIMVAGAGGLVLDAQIARAELAAVQLAGPALAPGFRPDEAVMPQIYTGPYLAAVAAWGSPADSPASLGHLAPALRAHVDSVLLRGLPMHVVSVSASDTPAGGCPVSVVDGIAQTPMPSSGVWVTTTDLDALVTVRAYSPTFQPVPGGTIGTGQHVHLVWTGAPKVPVTWTVGVAASDHIRFTCR